MEVINDQSMPKDEQNEKMLGMVNLADTKRHQVEVGVTDTQVPEVTNPQLRFEASTNAKTLVENTNVAIQHVHAH